jgi:hypothetical protein
MKMKNAQTNVTPKRKVFNEKFEDYSDSEVLKELLFTQRITVERLENIRKNTSNLVWFLIVIPIVMVVLFGFMS